MWRAVLLLPPRFELAAPRVHDASRVCSERILLSSALSDGNAWATKLSHPQCALASFRKQTSRDEFLKSESLKSADFSSINADVFSDGEVAAHRRPVR